ncbi:4-hydroxythreonine-4-phosphate dehydrogenase PdxA [Candidatus Aerophobetes bacterium]|nr:4-hydroxythreonine-4-phosphate dehydrogenase PdxA [Candidatus Aerophobetes bacterium]
MREDKPLLGITMGDPAGIGPEIIVMSLVQREIQNICAPVVIGDRKIIKEALEITSRKAKVRAVKRIKDCQFAEGVINVLDLQNVDSEHLIRGKITPMAGRAAFDYIKEAIHLALSGKIEAIVTAPLNKEALNIAGYHYPGHTEILAELCRAKEVVMMLIRGNLRVSHVTTHLPLREIFNFIKRERIFRVITITYKALQNLGINRPRLAVAGLNPHAGEGGLLGKEEINEILPAIKKAHSLGIEVQGPFSGDTLFYRAKQGEFDGIIAMYHDQGHIPLKTQGFFEGVNLTLGLPFVRTSVVHGTAFDKAGKGIANPQSLIEAIKLAILMLKKAKNNKNRR